MVYILWVVAIYLLFGSLSYWLMSRKFPASQFVKKLVLLINDKNYERAIQLCNAVTGNNFVETCKNMLTRTNDPPQIELQYQTGYIGVKNSHGSVNKTIRKIELIHSVLFSLSCGLLALTVYLSGVGGWKVVVPTAIIFTTMIASYGFSYLLNGKIKEELAELARFRAELYQVLNYAPPECTPEPIKQ